MRNLLFSLALVLVGVACCYFYWTNIKTKESLDKYQTISRISVREADSLREVANNLDFQIFKLNTTRIILHDSIIYLKEELSKLKIRQNEEIIFTANLPDSVSFRQITARYHH